MLVAGGALPPKVNSPARAQGIRFAAQVPPLPATVPVFKLALTAAPTEFVNEHLRLVGAPALKLGQTNHVSMLAQKDLVRAHINAQTGDTSMVPDMERLITLSKGVPGLTQERAQSIAKLKFADVRFIPHDVTELRMLDKVDVMGGSAARPKATGGPSLVQDMPAVRFSVVPAQRFADSAPVFGPGSRAAVTLSNTGSVEGLVRKWKTATLSHSVKPDKNAAGVQAAITQQLAPYMSSNVQITVDSITRAYYDGNANFLSPVYSFTATLHPTSGKASNEHIQGFVPIGTQSELLPAIQNRTNMKQPTTAPKPAALLASLTSDLKVHNHGTGAQGAITVGSYINRDGKMLDMWWNFWDSLNFKFPGLTPMTPFTLSQYYWAEPWDVNGATAQARLNAVNIAYTDPHGNWWYNTTLNNNADGWTIQAISPGFGAGTGGQLATWIIDSCEVAPSFYDLQVQAGNGYKAFDPWWGVFKGLHNVVAFRTEMWLYQDAEESQFGLDMAMGCDVHTSWFQVLAADSANNQTYLDTNINQVVHYGRGSVFIDSRNLGQSIYHVEHQSPAGQIWNFWMSN